ncbi:expressed unknown protein [Seminavis robusta]|uniref:RanBD1 domain-containing protein n=1 Tax=Seminavis robusta TaxID=568900 RepID=A0A9N8E2C2_9STRA|nr:expressed unknown protein [Seminavis robusta]|eukprot:Sro546_g164050.1 n/a (200) ;mRNA; f:24310-24909
MEEVPNSKQDVKLYRRFPDDESKEVDFGPGYLKLYKPAHDNSNGHKTSPKLQIVFRSHGTMKIRANHVLSDEVSLDVSFENELRYAAMRDVADMMATTAVVYGRQTATKPQDFPLSFEFDSEEERDKFVISMQEHLGLTAQEQPPKASKDDNEIKEETATEAGERAGEKEGTTTKSGEAGTDETTHVSSDPETKEEAGA